MKNIFFVDAHSLIAVFEFKRKNRKRTCWGARAGGWEDKQSDAWIRPAVQFESSPNPSTFLSQDHKPSHEHWQPGRGPRPRWWSNVWRHSILGRRRSRIQGRWALKPAYPEVVSWRAQGLAGSNVQSPPRRCFQRPIQYTRGPKQPKPALQRNPRNFRGQQRQYEAPWDGWPHMQAPRSQRYRSGCTRLLRFADTNSNQNHQHLKKDCNMSEPAGRIDDVVAVNVYWREQKLHPAQIGLRETQRHVNLSILAKRGWEIGP